MTGPLIAAYQPVVRDRPDDDRWRCLTCRAPFPTALALVEHIVALTGKPHQLTTAKEVTP